MTERAGFKKEKNKTKCVIISGPIFERKCVIISNPFSIHPNGPISGRRRRRRRKKKKKKKKTTTTTTKEKLKSKEVKLDPLSMPTERSRLEGTGHGVDVYGAHQSARSSSNEGQRVVAAGRG